MFCGPAKTATVNYGSKTWVLATDRLQKSDVSVLVSDTVTKISKTENRPTKDATTSFFGWKYVKNRYKHTMPRNKVSNGVSSK